MLAYLEKTATINAKSDETQEDRTFSNFQPFFAIRFELGEH
jgi:hypothetical protein